MLVRGRPGKHSGPSADIANQERMEMKRRAALIAAAITLAVLAPVQSAGANIGGGYGTAWGPDGESVTGSGKFVFAGSGSNVIVEFECDVTASPGLSPGKVPTGVRIATPAEDGCVLKQDGTPVARAPGESLPGAFAATQDQATVAFGAGALEICWFVEAFFRDGSSLPHEGCADGDVVPSTPESVTGSGAYAGAGSGSRATVAFQCHAIASAGAEETSVEECVLKQGGFPVAQASPMRGPGSFAATASLATIQMGQGQLELCWEVQATFLLSGRTVSDRSCGDGTILDLSLEA